MELLIFRIAIGMLKSCSGSLRVAANADPAPELCRNGIFERHVWKGCTVSLQMVLSFADYIYTYDSSMLSCESGTATGTVGMGAAEGYMYPS